MKYYVVVKIDGKGDQEVHKATCNYLPLIHKRELIGDYTSSIVAVQAAIKRGFIAANGCYWCNFAAHTANENK